MPHPKSDVTITDGQMDWSGGVDSIKATTIQSQLNPNGLARNQLAWLQNATVRDGGITQRWGWQPLGTVMLHPTLYQGGFLYEPDADNPYFIFSIGGRIIKVLPDDATHPVDLSTAFGLTNPADQPRSFFCQAEKYLIIQAGDDLTLPLFWDGTTLRRSVGITNTVVAPGTNGVNEIPAATAMDYYMGRVWYAQFRTYSAGDIVGGPSGTLANQFRDAVLNVTESPLVLGGDGFTVPTNAGNIRALKHSANLDAALGQGRLYIFTRKAIYSLIVPVTRNDWINTNSNNQPLQSVVQLVNGSVNDRSVVPVNGDLYYQSLEPGIRSLVTAVRYFQQPGNIDISANVERVLQFNDRSLLSFGSGIEWDERLLQTALPFHTSVGVIHKAIVPLDFVPLSTLQQPAQPVWEGVYEGLDTLELFTGDFGGRQRAFSMIVSRVDNSFQLWELTDFSRTENGDNRVTWRMEFPAYTWGQEFMLKKLVSGELWIDRLRGTVVFNAEFRPDGETCWKPWLEWEACSPKNTAEDSNDPIEYPVQELGPCYRSTMSLPLPPESCETQTGRPVNVGYQFQVRLTIKGFCRVRGLLLHAEPVDRSLYAGMVC